MSRLFLGQIYPKSIYFESTGVSKMFYGLIQVWPDVSSYIITGGNSFSILSDISGKSWGWGYGHQGQLGNNIYLEHWEYIATPVAICGNHTFVQIAGSSQSVIALDISGKTWGWGGNYNCELGNGFGGVGDKRSTPVAVCGNHSFCAVAGGLSSFFGIDNNGSAWAWGYNIYGELGNNSTGNKCTPVLVYGNHTFCKISAGIKLALALDNNGYCWSWGKNGGGELGDNSIISRITPVAVCGNHIFCDISAGGFQDYDNSNIYDSHSVGIDNSGKTWAWGNNAYGALGDGTNINRHTPISIYGSHTFCQISAGKGGFTLAIDTIGKTWAWGRNSYGQLGDYTITCRNTPVEVYGNHNFCRVYGAQSHSLAIDINGVVWGWGKNWYGSIGDNSNVDKCTPVRVYNNYY